MIFGGSLAQPFRYLLPNDGGQPYLDKQLVNFGQHYRLAAFDFRAHGRTPVGDRRKLRLDVFAEDLIAFLDHLRIQFAVIGGISMGAAVALRTALRHPERCRALVLCRPAWLNDSMSQAALAAYGTVVRLLSEEHLPEDALRRLEETEIYHEIKRQSADAAKSLLGQVRCVVTDPAMREATLARLQYLPSGQPGLDPNSAIAVTVPTLIMATPNDPIHPLSYGEVLASAIPNASFVQLAPKEVQDGPHIREVNTHITRFLESVSESMNPQPPQ
jgi:pimeloyl-ACP methyl ester carboxylesterase